MELVGATELPCAPDTLRGVLLNGPALARLVAPDSDVRAVRPGEYEGEITLGTPPFARRHRVAVRIGPRDDGVLVDVRGQGRSQGIFLEVRCDFGPGHNGATRMGYRVHTELGSLGEALGSRGLEKRVGELLEDLRALLAAAGSR